MRSFAFLGAIGLLSLAACADTEPVDDDGDIYVTTGVGGGDGGSTDTGRGGRESTGVWGNDGAGGAGGDSEGSGPYPIILAHGFFGFEEFAGADFLTYFYGVKAYLAEHGEAQVFTPAVDPFNDSATRGAQLLAHVEAVLAETGARKVVIIGHSQGGLDARVVAHDRPELVAAVLTVATPHQGSPVANIALGITENDQASDIVDDLVNLIGAALYDEVGDETSVSDALYQFSTPGINEFNAAYPAAPGVFYASITGRSDNHLGGQVCATQVKLDIVDDWRSMGDPIEPLFFVSEAILDAQDAPNDGLVRVVDAKYGEFWGCFPADHMDEIGQLFGDDPGFQNPFDHKALFLELVRELRRRGY